MKIEKVLSKRARNWWSWSQSMCIVFDINELTGYVNGTIRCPNLLRDPVGVSNWCYNDSYAKMLITNNIAQSKEGYVSHCSTSRRMWHNLKHIYESRSCLLFNDQLKTIFDIQATENMNIAEHLAKIQNKWEQLTLFHEHNQLMSDAFFKRTIAQSLPRSWRTFTSQYIPAYVDEPDQDPKKQINSQEFIGLIEQEWELSESLKKKEAKAVKQGNQSSVPLANRITDASTSCSSSRAKKHCEHCWKDNHKTSKCHFLDISKCKNCDCFHRGDCWQPRAEGNNKRAWKGKEKESSNKKKKESHNAEANEQSNTAIQDEEVALEADDESDSSDSDSDTDSDHVTIASSQKSQLHCLYD